MQSKFVCILIRKRLTQDGRNNLVGGSVFCSSHFVFLKDITNDNQFEAFPVIIAYK